MNKTIIISLLAMGLLTSCAVQTVCPAYQSAFVLDQKEQDQMFSLFTVVEGDTVPKRPVGFRFRADEGDSLMDKFLKGTPGRGFRVQKGPIHSQEKAGFTYENRKKEKLWAKVFNGREKPVLENPYLFDRITKKRPFYKLDGMKTSLVHFNGPEYRAYVKSIINSQDSSRYDTLMAEMAALPTAIQVQYAPLLRGGFNVEQEAYNQRFQEYFLQVKEAEVLDSASLEAFQSDTVATDSTTRKKGLFGIFKKRNKAPKPKKEKKKKSKEENGDGLLEEEENLF